MGACSSRRQFERDWRDWLDGELPPDGRHHKAWRRVLASLSLDDKSIKPDSKFNFINVAIWENEDVYWKAYDKSVTPMKAKLGELNCEMTPALYNVAFEY